MKKHVKLLQHLEIESIWFCHSYIISIKKSQVECNQDAEEDISDDEFDELDEIEYFESEALKLILKGDIAIIKTGDDHPYYLLKLMKDPDETQETITDS